MKLYESKSIKVLENSIVLKDPVDLNHGSTRITIL